MSTHPEESSEEPIPLWRARACFHGATWIDAAYGFGGPDVAETTGSAAQTGAALTGFLNSLEMENIQAALAESGRLAIRLEVEPHAGDFSGPTVTGGADRGGDCVPQWEAEAAAGNARGSFDACYAFGNSQGDEGHLLGTAQELGEELARVLAGPTRGDAEVMKYGTDRFLVELVIQPHPRQ